MPRHPRIDGPGLLYRVMASGKGKLASFLDELNDAFTKAVHELEVPEKVLVFPVFHAYLKADEIPGIPSHHGCA